jgi:endoglucanase
MIWTAFASLVVILSIGLFAACVGPRDGRETLEIIPRAWSGYKAAYIGADGRVERPLNEHDTVSEGQAYGLLLSALLNDRTAFESIWQWTTTALSRKEKFGDRLLAWHWTPANGVIDWNSASDADVDVALALIIAGTRWSEDRYLNDARALLADILKLESTLANGRRVLLPGNWQPKELVLNPSYFSPAHYRIFAALTNDGRWTEMVEPTYEIIQAAAQGMGDRAGVGLVPDWISLQADGRPTIAEGFSHHVSWDAMRIPWRLGMDYFWFHEARALAALQRMQRFYAAEWERRGGHIFAEYDYRGEPRGEFESVAAYAMIASALRAADSPLLPDVLRKIKTAYQPETSAFQDRNDYYQNSLTLLGLLLLKQPTSPVPI